MCRVLGVGLLVLMTAQTVSAQQPEPASPAPKTRKAQDAYWMLLGRYGQFVASDAAFKDIYGKGFVYGGEIRIAGPRLFSRRIIIWAEGNYRERDGQFSLTREPTNVKVTAAEGGLLYRLMRGNASLYIGGGIGYYMFVENNEPIGEAKQDKIGYCGVAGVSVAVISHIVMDVRVKYSASRMQPADFPIEVGGITFDGGIGVRF